MIIAAMCARFDVALAPGQVRVGTTDSRDDRAGTYRSSVAENVGYSLCYRTDCLDEEPTSLCGIV